MQRLNGPRLKVQRAIKHLEALKKRRDAFGEANPCEYVRQRRGDGATYLGEFIFIARTGLPEPPEEWGVLVGEIAHQIRSALDQLLWQVSKHRCPTLSDSARLYFPIKAHRSDFQSAILSHLQYLTKRVQQARIRRAQPYFRRKDPLRTPLWIVDNIDIADKHITIPITPVYAWMRSVSITPINCRVELISQLVTGQTVEAGTEFLRLGITEVRGSNPRVDMQADFRFAIQFGAFRSIPGDIPVVPIFEEAIQQVQDLIEAFERDP